MKSVGRYLLSRAFGLSAVPSLGTEFEWGVKTMLWTVFVILLVLWLLGLLTNVGGGLVHLLLVVAAIVLIFNLFSGRRTVV